MSAHRNAVFLSYASQDAEAARRICHVLRVAGVEVWFDQSELRGGDAWDAKIRKQIKECALFMPVISAATQARHEGYFRLEWKLAAQRTHMMSGAIAFLVPVVIDDTRDDDAHVPEEFRAVQWTRLPGGEATEAFCARVKVLLAGELGTRPPSAAVETVRPRAVALPKKRWLAPALIAIAVAGIGLAFWSPGVFNPKLPPARGGQETQNSKPTGGSVPLSEARQLTLKARALIDDDLMAGREAFRLADELAQRAVTLAPDDGEAWATAARVSMEVIRRRYDITSARQALARTQVERAGRLAPDSVESGLAMAAYLLEKRDIADVERRLRDLSARASQDARVLLMLARVLDTGQIPRHAEATEIRLKHPAFSSRDPRPMVEEVNRLHIRKQFAEAESLVDRAQALAPSLEGYYKKLLLVTQYWRDKDAARAFVDKLPTPVLLEDAFASRVAQFYIRLGDAWKAQELLRRVPRDFFEEKQQVLPKGFHAGWAQQIAGRTGAAQAEWKQALSVVEKRMVAEPNQPELIGWKARLLALTGQREDAEKAWQLYGEFMGRVEGQQGFRFAEFYLELGQPENARRVLQNRGADRRSSRAVEEASTVLYDPWFEPIRKDPAMRQFVAGEEAWLQQLWQPGAKTAAAEPAPAVSLSRTGPADQSSIAVLALDDMSPNKDAEYFSDGVSEEILNALANNSALRVAARTSSFSFKGRKVPIAEIGRALNVARVIEGSVQKAGNKVRISVRLINAADGYQIWSEPFERDLTDIFAVQAEIAAKVAQKMSGAALVAVTPGTVVAPTKDLAAYDAYLRGRARHTGEQPRTMGDTRNPNSFYQEAVRLDPGFALAWARLAQYDAAVLVGGLDRTDARAASARDAAEKARALNPDLPETRLALGLVRLHVDRDFDAAEKELMEAERRRPNDADVAAARAQLEWSRGRWGPHAAALVLRSVELDPRNTGSMDINCQILTEMGCFADAEALCQRWLTLVPGGQDAALRRSRNHLAWTGDVPTALAFLDASTTQGTDRIPIARGALRAAEGNWEAAIAEYDRRRSATRTTAGRSGPRGNAVLASLWVARLEARRGNTARAAECQAEALERAQQYVVDFPELDRGHAYVAIGRAARGERTEALAAMGEAVRIAERRRDASQLAIIRRFKADVLTLLGLKDAAIAELRAMHAMGYGHGHRLRLEPEWLPLRAEPAFQQLMKEAEERAIAQGRRR